MVTSKLQRHLETRDPSERNFIYCNALVLTQTEQEHVLDCVKVSDQDTTLKNINGCKCLK